MWAGVSLGVGCGSTSLQPTQAGPAVVTTLDHELCNGLDDDADGRVDEVFRDELGRYVDDAHCGSCAHDCNAALAHATAQGCRLIGEVPECVALTCDQGFLASDNGRCVSLADQLCRQCESQRDCGGIAAFSCVQLASGSYCLQPCAPDQTEANGCSNGYSCQQVAAEMYCVPQHGDCSCETLSSFTRGCAVTGPIEDAAQCPGQQRCEDGVLAVCEPDSELCDAIDNDCDGRVDEGFANEQGIYNVDSANCGACGVDCGEREAFGIPLECGGDTYAPSCVLACPDARDGVQIGDHLDADHRPENGCECQVRSLSDEAASAAESAPDDNCDGADGEVSRSFYVAVGGDDTGPGSATRPFASLERAAQAAADSLQTSAPRPHVFVASGTYTGVVQLKSGVQLHGGYRSDFLARNPDDFAVTLIAPPESAARFGAALIISAEGDAGTLVEGFQVRGFDATAPGTPAIAVLVEHSSAALTLRDLRVQAGKVVAGRAGDNGAAAERAANGGNSDPPRASIEDGAHACSASADNRTQGGSGGHNVCGATDVSGGAGGSAMCPALQALEASGGVGLGSAGGAPGVGGTDVDAPVTDRDVCSSGVCCGLADFNVPSVYRQATAGADGAAGADGPTGAACADPLGHFDGETWIAGNAGDGLAGTPGSGGGGGGAGGGVVIAWTTGVCEFVDGLGGAGGGGGAGGCAGQGGKAGQSTAPVIGVWIALTDAKQAPQLSRLTIETSAAADGGDGGAGGDGALGGSGGLPGKLAGQQLSTPTLAGAATGQRGGHGGKGGSGGSGGGGCGGSSVGLWFAGARDAASQLEAAARAAATFALGSPGRAGRGGAGAVPAQPGAAGRAIDVLVR